MIYADNAATTRISEFALSKMLPFLQGQYGNASSQYRLGTQAKTAVEFARSQVAKAIGAETSEIVFTSGGSEANSWVFQSVAHLFKEQDIHIITSSIEHHSVLNVCRNLESKRINITYLPVSTDGEVSVDSVANAIRPTTRFVSIMLANNEIGTLQPISEIGSLLKERNILFHTDAVQAVGHIPFNVNKLGVDFLSASAHKFNGAKGTGFLYVQKDHILSPLIFGGNQEKSLRAGTENVAGIVAAGYALDESVSRMHSETTKLQNMISSTVAIVREHIPDVRINGGGATHLPGTVNLGFNRVSGEAMMNLLDLRNICVSTSSACNSGNSNPSHVLLALGQSEDQAKAAIRVSYGFYNSQNDANAVATAICDAYDKITGLSRV